jgi:hypothetical protein
MCVLAIINGAVDGDGPHAGRIPVTVAIIVFTAVTTGPHVDVAQTVAALNRTVRSYELPYFHRGDVTFRLSSCWLRKLLVFCVFSNVTEELGASIFRADPYGLCAVSLRLTDLI